MINLKLRDEMQNIYLLTYTYITVSFNEVWTKRKSVMGN